jgi:hypothetical protein
MPDWNDILEQKIEQNPQRQALLSFVGLMIHSPMYVGMYIVAGVNYVHIFTRVICPNSTLNIPAKVHGYKFRLQL